MKKVILMSLFFAVISSAQNFEAENLFNEIEKASPNELIAIIKQGKSDSEKIDSYSLIILSLASLKSCSGQVILATVLDSRQNFRSDSLGVIPPLYA
ncbi:hypothetical protein, partial [Marinicella meishanensis]|uniref:hypothetical protein n=1 Tax=Marinicella meishanensis TaxID=2873263 RepID=UPI001CBF4975